MEEGITTETAAKTYGNLHGGMEVYAPLIDPFRGPLKDGNDAGRPDVHLPPQQGQLCPYE